MNHAVINTVLFDLDGTLVDSATELGAAADKMRIDRGMAPFFSSAYRHMAGSGAKGMLDVAFDITPDSSSFESMKEEFLSNYELRMLSNTPLFDGVDELVKSLLAHDLQWGVVTNKAARFTDPLTMSLPLFSTAAAIVSGDTTPFAKPHPMPLLEAARKIGVLPEECVYVGDDIRDIIAGRAAGMQTVAATYGYLGAEADIAAWGADGLISSPLDLLKVLKLA